ncbi:unnamed protein product, partial [Tetraodon nigroviridis]
MKTVAVLGGGVAGLAASFYLCRSPQVTKVILVESSGRLGGWLSSTRRADGAVFEHGPRGIRPAGALGRNTLNMVDELGLQEEIVPVPSSHAASRNRYLYVNQKLHRMPSGLRGLVRTVPPFSRPLLLNLAQEMLVKKGQQEDETIHSFFSRRLGQELADIAVDSLCRGVFAGDCRRLSVRSCFPPLFQAEQRRGSLLLGMMLGSGPGPVVPPGALALRSVKESWAQWSLRRGVESLPEALAEFLRRSGKVELHVHAPVAQIQPSASGWKICLEDGVLSADHVISALPAKALASALPPSCRPLTQQLKGIETVTVAVVNLEYEGSVLPVEGFGHLLPSSEDPALLGVVYDSEAFPQHNRPTGTTTRLTVMMGGAWFHAVGGPLGAVPEEALLSRATEAVHAHLHVSAAPIWSHVSVQKDCIPQYYQGHSGRLASMRSFIRKENLALSLIGSSYDGVSVNDVIYGGRTAAEELLGAKP